MQSGIPYGQAFVKNSYVGRTFIKPKQKSRESSVQVKLNVLKEMNPDVFISLINDPGFAVEYMARTSNARFKIGRKQLPGNLFDLVIKDPAGKDLSQLQSFQAMKEYLNRIQ